MHHSVIYMCAKYHDCLTKTLAPKLFVVNPLCSRRPIGLYVLKLLQFAGLANDCQRQPKFGTYMLHSFIHVCAKYHDFLTNTLASKPYTVNPRYTRVYYMNIDIGPMC
jgi:hypothetical protein